METEYSYNLIDEKWIKVLTKKGNNIYSILDVFENAENIISLENENKYIDYSIYRILLAILITAYNRNEYKCRNITDSSKFEYKLDVIEDYLLNQCDESGIKIHDLFDLYDNKRPFLQMTPEQHEMSSVTKIYNNIIKINNESQEYSSFKESEFYPTINSIIENGVGDSMEKLCLSDSGKTELSRTQVISDDWIARNFLSYRLYHPAKNNGPTNPDFRINPLYLKYDNVLYFGKNLIDYFEFQYQQNFDIKLYPLWENNEFDDIELTEVITDKNRKYYEYIGIKGEQKYDIAKILTYSNTIFYLDRSKNLFYRAKNIPFSFNRNEKDLLNILQFNDTNNEIRDIDSNLEKFELINKNKLKYKSILRKPKCTDSKLCKIEKLYNNEIVLYSFWKETRSKYDNFKEDVSVDIENINGRLKSELDNRDLCINDEIKELEKNFEKRILAIFYEEKDCISDKKKNSKLENIMNNLFIKKTKELIEDRLYEFCLSYVYEDDWKKIRESYDEDTELLKEDIKKIISSSLRTFERVYCKQRVFGIYNILNQKKKKEVKKNGKS